MRQITLQRNIRLSKCKLWQWQKDFFDKEGINAWDQQVPYYITSNPFLANSYAKIIMQFMRDCINQQIGVADKPFYILELGAGHGKFSFYVIKRLLELQNIIKLQIPFVYVISDFTEKNLQFCQSHPALQTYINEGYLDFAIYDATTNNDIRLLNANVVLNQKVIVDPLICIANYFFDTIPHDVFRIEGGILQEGLVTLQTENPDQQRKLREIEDHYTYRNITLPYYNECDLDNILQDYVTTLSDTTFLLPIASLRCIKKLKSLSATQKMLLLAADEGHTELIGLKHAKEPDILHHASFSMRVNLHAIGEYCKSTGGDYYHQPIQPGIKLSCFLANGSLKDLAETNLALNENVTMINMYNFYLLHKHLEKSKHMRNLNTILSCLSLSDWDPKVFHVYLDDILGMVNNAEQSLKQGFIEGMNKIIANSYYIIGDLDTMKDVGDFYSVVGDYEKALFFYEKSPGYKKEWYQIFFNIGHCYYHMGKFDKAYAILNRASEINPYSCAVKTWLEKTIDAKETAKLMTRNSIKNEVSC